MKKYLVLQTNGVFKEVYEEDYSSSYELLRDNVGGYIECVSFIECFSKRGIDLWVNEEGKLIDLLPSVALLSNEKVVEVLNGNIVFSRVDEEGDTIPLNDEDIEFIKKVFRNKMGIIQYVSNITGNALSNLVPFVEV